MEFQNIFQLIKVVSESEVNQFKIEEGSLKIFIDKRMYVPNSAESIQPVTAYTTELAFSPSFNENTPKVDLNIERAYTKVLEKIEDNNIKEVKSPIVGMFYSAAGPDLESFVHVGDKVKKGQVLCIIEAMKLMNEIKSEFDGEVVEILADNEDVLEYNQVIYRINTNCR